MTDKEKLETILEKLISDEAGNLRDSFEQETKFGQITPELLDIAYDFFSNISLGQQIKLNEWLEDIENTGENRQIAFFLDKVKDDLDNDIELYDHILGEIESDFWAWFRETFYNE